jgi:predicted nucleic acid-binding Zn ribbon protein
MDRVLAVHQDPLCGSRLTTDLATDVAPEGVHCKLPLRALLCSANCAVEHSRIQRNRATSVPASLLLFLLLLLVVVLVVVVVLLLLQRNTPYKQQAYCEIEHATYLEGGCSATAV